jgi:uncharacterized protein YdeI (YjbR/CyaY-like superfamily)
VKATFFADRSELRQWLKENHRKARELWVGYYKQGSGKANFTWSESVDEALCYGWIDGIRKTIDEASYTIRLTPRKPNSNWSAINIKKVEELTRRRLMRAAGVKAFAKRREESSSRYSYEQQTVELEKKYERKFKTHAKAWKFFQSLTPSTKRPSIWWVVSAKKEETRRRRLDILIHSSKNGQEIPPLRRNK